MKREGHFPISRSRATNATSAASLRSSFCPSPGSPFAAEPHMINALQRVLDRYLVVMARKHTYPGPVFPVRIAHCPMLVVPASFHPHARPASLANPPTRCPRLSAPAQAIVRDRPGGARSPALCLRLRARTFWLRARRTSIFLTSMKTHASFLSCSRHHGHWTY
jgi:hypothetical protein